MELDVVRTLSAAGLVSLLLFSACSGVVHESPATGGTTGDGATGGTAGEGGLGTSPSTPAEGGNAGAAPGCDGGLRVLRTIDAGYVVAWPEQRRVAFMTHTSTIEVDDASAVAEGGPLTRLAVLSSASFGLSSDWTLRGLLAYGDALLVTASTGQQTRIFIWDFRTGAAELNLALPAHAEPISIADPEAGLAFVADRRIYRALETAGNWLVGPPIGTSEQWRTPLAFADGELFVGLAESDRLYEGGEPGSAGEGGAASLSGGWSAKLERWNSASELVASYPTVGNPRVARPANGGWLVGESNSFWGSYQAALEWLPPSKEELRTLSQVPVISGGDSEDGAFGVAISDDRVFVANCESGLLSGAWANTAVTLTAVWPAAEHSSALCDPRSIQTLGELLLIGADPVNLARLCDE